MQDRVSIQLDNEVVFSKRFDMRCYRMMHELRTEGKDNLEVSEALLYEMFDGTKVTNEILSLLSAAERVFLCGEIQKICISVMERLLALKNAESPPVIKITTGTES
ncbi:MAG: hypothetical protein J6A61_05785 [Clostridia bacterium]|nr:hypothetical protein [Clostridia bacterium]